MTPFKNILICHCPEVHHQEKWFGLLLVWKMDWSLIQKIWFCLFGKEQFILFCFLPCCIFGNCSLLPPITWDQTQLNTSNPSSQITSDGITPSLWKIRSKNSISRPWKLFQSCSYFWKLFCPPSLPVSMLLLKRYSLLMRYEWEDN